MMDLNDNPASALCASLRLQDTDSDKPGLEPSHSSELDKAGARLRFRKRKKDLTIILLQLIEMLPARLLGNCFWSVNSNDFIHTLRPIHTRKSRIRRNMDTKQRPLNHWLKRLNFSEHARGCVPPWGNLGGAPATLVRVDLWVPHHQLLRCHPHYHMPHHHPGALWHLNLDCTCVWWWLWWRGDDVDWRLWTKQGLPTTNLVVTRLVGLLLVVTLFHTIINRSWIIAIVITLISSSYYFF